MARRTEFKGIVRNFTHMLNGRNNDHLGYWAIGQLCLLAKFLKLPISGKKKSLPTLQLTL